MAIVVNKRNEYTEYFRAYVRAKELSDGDTVKAYEYMNWINGKHDQFRKKIGLDKYTPYTDKQAQEFLEYINQ